jgi:hypothetical protein
MSGKELACKKCRNVFIVSRGTAGPPRLPPAPPVPVAKVVPAAWQDIAAGPPPAVEPIPTRADPLPHIVRPIPTRRKHRASGGRRNTWILWTTAGVCAFAGVLLIVHRLCWLAAMDTPEQHPAANEMPAANPPPAFPIAPAAAAVWDVVPDPLAQHWTMPAGPPGKVPAPFGEEITFASTSSPYVAIGRNFLPKDKRLLIDLRTMQPAGSIPGDIPIEHVAISPDGKYLAGVRSLARDTVQVYAFRNGQKVHEVRVQGSITVDWVGLTPNNRLLTTRGNNRDKTLEVWDLHQDKPLKAWAVPAPFRPCMPAVSPGGRYVAMSRQDPENNRQGVVLYDLVQLRVAGEIVVSPPQRFANSWCDGLAFSPDGAELAGVFLERSAYRLNSWSLDRGAATVGHSLSGNLHLAAANAHVNSRPTLQWWPDRKGWLVFDSKLIDYQTGAEVVDLMPRGSRGPRHLLPGDLLAQVSGTMRGQYLDIVPLPAR